MYFKYDDTIHKFLSLSLLLLFLLSIDNIVALINEISLITDIIFDSISLSFSAPLLGENSNSNYALVDKIDVIGVTLVAVLLYGDANVDKLQ